MDYLGWVTVVSSGVIGILGAWAAIRKVVQDRRAGVRGHELEERREYRLAQNELIDQYQEDRTELRKEVNELKQEISEIREFLSRELAYARLLVDFIYRNGLQPPSRDGHTYTGGRVPPNEVGE